MPSPSASPQTSPAPRRLRGLAPVVALVAFAAAAGLFRIKAYDLFWHLATGRWIWTWGALPRVDPFRFTSDGAPWVDHEWLFQVAIHGLERLVGLNGLIVVRSSIAVGLAILLLVGLRRSGLSRSQAVLLALAVVLGARPRMFLRPEVVTLVLLTIFLSLLQEARRAGGAGHPGSRRRWLALAAALVVPWANFHPGALVAPPVAGAYLLGAKLWGPRTETGWGWRTVLGFPALLLGLIGLNPYGFRIFAVPLEIGSSLEGLGGVNPEWLPIWSGAIARDSVYFFSVLGALAALVALTLRRGGPDAPGVLRRLQRLDGATGLAALALLVLSATSIRHQPLFYVAAALFAGECLAGRSRETRSGPGEPSPRGGKPRSGRLALLATGLCLLALLWVVLPPSRGPLAPRQGRYHLGLGLEPNRFPVGQADALLDWQSAPGGDRKVGPLYNNVAWGGYLLWRLFPPRQVFVDGRNEVDPEILREMADGRRSNRGWIELLERYQVDGAVVRYDPRPLQVLEASPEPGAPPRATFRTPNALFFPRDSFALVQWDDAGMLLLRRTPEREAILKEVETRWADPEDIPWTLAQAEGDPIFRARALTEVRRKLEEDPGCARARALLDALLALEDDAPSGTSPGNPASAPG